MERGGGNFNKCQKSNVAKLLNPLNTCFRCFIGKENVCINVFLFKKKKMHKGINWGDLNIASTTITGILEAFSK